MAVLGFVCYYWRTFGYYLCWLYQQYFHESKLVSKLQQLFPCTSYLPLLHLHGLTEATHLILPILYTISECNFRIIRNVHSIDWRMEVTVSYYMKTCKLFENAKKTCKLSPNENKKLANFWKMRTKHLRTFWKCEQKTCELFENANK